ncbi:MAG: molecular chaperone TorD family protein [Candidatus Marinimicrobia bacterium]|jgi:TorA maturation chaperone TorD|nr:molecular chaperone TorD family protein [Candidatus Neomarinimicrobiota bacterium]
MNTSTKQNYLLEARSTLYGFVSTLFSDPESEKFSMMKNPEFQKMVLNSCSQFDENNESELSGAFQKVISMVNELNRETIQNENVDIFGHTLSKQTAPYALEHLKSTDVFFRTQKLADLNGFYKAFGMEVECVERADHIATQTEFLSYLILKECLAIRRNLEEETEVCHKAFIDFNQEHFYDWVKMFSENIMEKVEGIFYPAAAEFLSIFLENEKQSIPA